MRAGVLVTLATNPLWVVKTRMQLDSMNVAPAAVRKATTAASPALRTSAAGGLISAVRSVLRTDGLTGFYRGIGPALMLCSHGAVQMMAYEELKGLRRQQLGAAGINHVPHLDSLAMGAVAKLAASSFTYPLQVRTRRGTRVHAFPCSATESTLRASVTRCGGAHD